MSTRRKVAMAATLAVVFGATFSVVRWGPSVAQFTGGGGTTEVSGTVEVSSIPAITGSVQAFPPDGGAEVRVTNNVRLDGPSDVTITGQSGPIDSTITNTYLSVGSGVGAPKIEAEVVGDLGGPVAVAGTVEVSGFSSVPTVALENGTLVSLTTTSLNALTYSTGRGNCEYAAGDPDSLTVDTTATNIPSSPLAGRTAVKICNMDTSKHMWCVPLGTASDTVGFPIFQHTCEKFEGINGGHVSCRCESATCNYAYLEEKCYQQP